MINSPAQSTGATLEHPITISGQFRLGQWLELPWVIGLAPLLLLPGRFLPIHWHFLLIPLLFLIGLGEIVFDRAIRLPTVVNGAWVLLLLCFPVSLWIAVDQTTAWTTAGYIALGLALFLALLHWPLMRQHPVLMLWALMLAGNAVTILGLSAVETQLTNGLTKLALPATEIALVTHGLFALTKFTDVVNPNIFASVSALLFPSYLALFLDWRRQKNAWLLPLWGLLCIGAGLLLVISRSRGSLLGAGIGAAVVIFTRWPRSIYLLIFTPLVVAAILTVFGEATVGAQFQLALSMAGLSGRQDIWYRALLALHDFSFTGIGMGMFSKVIPALYPYSVLQDANLPHAHNLFLQVGLDLGMLGLLAYSSLWLQLLFLLAGILRQPQRAREHTYALAALGSAVAVLANGMVDIALWGTKLAFLPWMLLAFGFRLGLSVAPKSRKHSHRLHTKRVSASEVI